jgi:hypothetical protein
MWAGRSGLRDDLRRDLFSARPRLRWHCGKRHRNPLRSPTEKPGAAQSQRLTGFLRDEKRSSIVELKERA